MNDDTFLRCSFCGRTPKKESRTLIVGPSVFICSDCVLSAVMHFSTKDLSQVPLIRIPRMDGKSLAMCQFCGLSQNERKLLVGTRTAIICDDCLMLCVGVLITRKAPPKVEDAILQMPTHAKWCHLTIGWSGRER